MPGWWGASLRDRLKSICADGEPWRTDWSRVSGRSLAALGYLIVLGSWIGFSAYVWLLRASTPSRVSTYAYVNPVIALFLGWAVLGESIQVQLLWARWSSSPASSSSLCRPPPSPAVGRASGGC